jgi:uncharacterized membrane protein YraQ (UPF0718 family)
MSPADLALRLLQGGLGNVAAYLAGHVLLCLLPAFYIAGAMTALIPKESITRCLGRKTPRHISYPAAALAGSVLAVCSCTIVPLFAGIYKKGAGLGPAITFLFFAPAANILALVYTGGVIGPDLAAARLLLSLAFGIGIGLIMAILFHKDDVTHEAAAEALFSGESKMKRAALLFLLVLVALLLFGTLKVAPLTTAYASMSLRMPGAEPLQKSLLQLVPFDAARGEEGLSVQGLVLILMLVLIGVASWNGVDGIFEGFGRGIWIALALTGATLLLAATVVTTNTSGVEIGLTGRFFAVVAALCALAVIAWKGLTRDQLRDWLWESWRFVKQIFPLLVAGVFVVGILRLFIRPEWIQALAGSNSVLGNLAGVAFGVFMYFPTLVEVPIAKMFLSLGMHRGPLLAYLMADPELSLQSILIISAIIGRLKTWTYVFLVAIFSATAGLIYGAWIDGMGSVMVAFYALAFVGALAGLLWWMRGRMADLVTAQKA